MDHLTTRFYVGMFDDASYHFLHEVFDWTASQDAEGSLGWVDVRHTIDYVSEVRAGDMLEIRACLGKIGTKSITSVYQMANVANGEVAARMESVSVLFDLKERVSVALSQQLRAKAERYLESGDED